MKKIEWCCHTKNGFELIEPNSNLAEAYLVKSDRGTTGHRPDGTMKHRLHVQAGS